MEENTKKFKRSRFMGTFSVVLFVVIVIIALIIPGYIIK
jgi:hypothetical protein